MIGSPPGFFITSLQFLPLKQQIRTHDQLVKGSDYIVLVEHRGFEPLTSTLRTLRATNCANAPYSLRAGDAAASTDNRYNSTTVCKLQVLFLLFSSDVR